MLTSLQKIKLRQEEIKSRMTSQPSPFSVSVDYSQLLKMSEELQKLKDEHKDILDAQSIQFEKIINKKVAEVTNVLQQIMQIQKGDKPIAGVDYPIPKDGETPIVDEQKIIKQVLSQIKQPSEQEIAKKVIALLPKPIEIDHQEIVDKVFIELDKGKRKLSTKHIGDFTNGLEQTIAPIRSLAARFRGGGDTIEAGTNIAITVVNGKKVISSLGGGAGNNFIYNEVVAGSGISFTLANVPITGLVSITTKQGKKLFPTQDYTIAGAVLTMVDTWLAGDIIADYQH